MSRAAVVLGHPKLERETAKYPSTQGKPERMTKMSEGKRVK